jgi:hypothetical protein
MDRSYVKGIRRAGYHGKRQVAPPSRTALLAVAGIVGVLLAGTVVLWAHYGTAVFFETIRAGLIACFG